VISPGRIVSNDLIGDPAKVRGFDLA